MAGELITSMLSESNLPHQFWAECLSAVVHVWNRCPTSAIQHSTPFEMWHKCKPDVSHLRVWGCLAYVHIQKDKRSSLGPHMEKCIFIGYPPGYKGWKFYNPLTKKTIISERAEFDGRIFPGLKMLNIPFPSHTIPTPDFTQMPDLGGESIQLRPIKIRHL